MLSPRTDIGKDHTRMNRDIHRANICYVEVAWILYTSRGVAYHAWWRRKGHSITRPFVEGDTSWTLGCTPRDAGFDS